MEATYRLYAAPYRKRRFGSTRVSGAFSRTTVHSFLCCRACLWYRVLQILTLEVQPMMKVSPSILSADFVNLERDIRALEPAGADYVHIDVMDGIFVPNITIGIPVVEAIRRISNLVLDVHLMILWWKPSAESAIWFWTSI